MARLELPLVKTELTPGREAILFVKPILDAGDQPIMRLVGVLYDDPNDPEQIEQTT